MGILQMIRPGALCLSALLLMSAGAPALAQSQGARPGYAPGIGLSPGIGAAPGVRSTRPAPAPSVRPGTIPSPYYGGRPAPAPTGPVAPYMDNPPPVTSGNAPAPFVNGMPTPSAEPIVPAGSKPSL